jgi:hypothetical protein
MKFKAEICLLVAAIVLFAVSAFLYSYASFSEGATLASSALFEYPYQGHAISFVGFGSLLMVTASISYMRRSKTTSSKIPNCTV